MRIVILSRDRKLMQSKILMGNKIYFGFMGERDHRTFEFFRDNNKADKFIGRIWQLLRKWNFKLTACLIRQSGTNTIKGE